MQNRATLYTQRPSCSHFVAILSVIATLKKRLQKKHDSVLQVFSACDCFCWLYSEIRVQQLEGSCSPNYNITVKLLQWNVFLYLKKTQKFLLRNEIHFSASDIKLCLYNIQLLFYFLPEIDPHISFDWEFYTRRNLPFLRPATSINCTLDCNTAEWG